MLMVVALERDGTGFLLNSYDCRIFAYEAILYGDNKQILYYPPFGNVFDNSKICWGNVPFDHDTRYTKQVAPTLLELFIGSGFNNHIFDQSAPVMEYRPNNCDQVFDCIQANGDKGFPYDKIKMKKKMTYGELISLITNLEGNER